MTDDLSLTFTVDAPPDAAYAAVTDVRGWWSGEIEGPTDTLGAAFTYRYHDLHRSTQKITELVPGRWVAWHVLDSHLAFVDDATEWTGTDITFDIAETATGTEVRFTHVGLVPADQCFDQCSAAWRGYVTGSLRRLITESATS